MAASAVPAGLSPAQLADFHRDGYLIIPSALTRATIASLLAETRRLLTTFSLDGHPLTRFTTGDDGDGDNTNHIGDDYFLNSGDKIRFFFEQDAFQDGRLVRPKETAVNKIGHCLHALSEPFAALLDDDAIVAAAAAAAGEGSEERAEAVSPAAIAQSLGFRDPRCLQSMVICKQAGIGGAVPPHQDSTFLYTRPPSAVGFWYALEDATRENGCLAFWPGSHRWAPVSRRLVRRAAGGGSGTEMVDNDLGGGGGGGGEKVGGPSGLFPRGEGYGASPPPGWEEEKSGEMGEARYVLGEVKAGDLVLIHGNLLHKSEKNTSSRGRIIYTFHVIEAHETEYDERNWLQPPSGGFTRLYKEV